MKYHLCADNGNDNRSFAKKEIAEFIRREGREGFVKTWRDDRSCTEMVRAAHATRSNSRWFSTVPRWLRDPSDSRGRSHPRLRPGSSAIVRRYPSTDRRLFIPPKNESDGKYRQAGQ